MKALVVTNKDKSARLDTWLCKKDVTKSRAFYQGLIKDGDISVNGKKTKPSYRIQSNDVITIKEKTIPPLSPIRKKLSILYEDNDMLVLDKPAGMAVHPTPHTKEETLVNYLLAYYPKISSVGEDTLRPGVVHRLDKPASGVMVVAKNNKTFDSLKELWKRGLVQKRYLVLVWGIIKERGSIELSIDRSKKTGRMVARKTGGKKALTLFNPIRRFTNATLLEVETKTGRTHQIRTHFKALGHPIIGDALYKNKKSKKHGLDRLFLHAHTLCITINSKKHIWKSPLPKSLKNHLASLKEVAS